MKKYDKYKDSGIEWIGEIPEGWKPTRIKKVAKYSIGGTPPRAKTEYFEGDNLWVSIRDLNQGDVIYDTAEKITGEGIKDSNCKLVPKGSLLYSFKLSVGLIALAGSDLYTNEAIASFSQESLIELKYLRYLLTVGFENNSRENIYGAKLFNQRLIDNAKVILPSMPEQLLIAGFLDEKTEKINKIIENKKKQVDLLKEKSRIEVNEIIHLGIKDSKYIELDIDWISKIPKTWKLKRMKDLTIKIGSGKTPKGGSENYPVEGIIFLRSQNIYFDDLRLNEVKYISQETHEEMNNTKVQPDDLLLNITGASIGRIGIFPQTLKEANVNQHVSIIRTNDKVYPRFIQYFLHSHAGQANIYSVQDGASKEGLSAKEISIFRVPYPPKKEQEEIIKFLDNYSKNISGSINTIQQEINKLEEYKKILINDCVTGKMKVTA
jgi:type I restriction enzyme, S subunit